MLVTGRWDMTVDITAPPMNKQLPLWDLNPAKLWADQSCDKSDFVIKAIL